MEIIDAALLINAFHLRGTPFAPVVKLIIVSLQLLTGY